MIKQEKHKGKSVEKISQAIKFEGDDRTLFVYGKQVVMYLALHRVEYLKEIYLSKEIDSKTFSLLSKTRRPILRLDNKKAQALARGGNHQGFLAKISAPKPISLKDIKQYDKILVLCGISDIGNIGAIFRSAYCLGVQGIIICLSEVLAFEGIVRTSVGALFELPFCLHKNTLDVINEFKNEGIYCYGADMNGEDIRNCKNIEGKWALFLGSEGEGLGRKISSKLDRIVSIKLKNDFDSLNVSVTAGILIHRMY